MEAKQFASILAILKSYRCFDYRNRLIGFLLGSSLMSPSGSLWDKAKRFQIPECQFSSIFRNPHFSVTLSPFLICFWLSPSISKHTHFQGQILSLYPVKIGFNREDGRIWFGNDRINRRHIRISFNFILNRKSRLARRFSPNSIMPKFGQSNSVKNGCEWMRNGNGTRRNCPLQRCITITNDLAG